MFASADDSNRIRRCEFGRDREADDDSDVGRVVGFGVPVARDLPGVFSRSHRIKDRLSRQPGRECSEVGGLYFFEFEPANGTVESRSDITTSTRLAVRTRYGITVVEADGWTA